MADFPASLAGWTANLNDRPVVIEHADMPSGDIKCRIRYTDTQGGSESDVLFSSLRDAKAAETQEEVA